MWLLLTKIFSPIKNKLGSNKKSSSLEYSIPLPAGSCLDSASAYKKVSLISSNTYIAPLSKVTLLNVVNPLSNDVSFPVSESNEVIFTKSPFKLVTTAVSVSIATV